MCILASLVDDTLPIVLPDSSNCVRLRGARSYARSPA
jgi:hypothetical protein